MRTKDEKKIFGLCENLVKISGGVEIFFARNRPKILLIGFRPIRTKKEKKNFLAICDPKMGQAEVYGKKYYAKTGQNFEKQKKTNLRNRSAQLLKKRASRSEKRRPSYAVHFERVKW